jgi:glutaredoxin 3
MTTPAITMYTTGWCPYCARARALLTRKGASWTEVDVEAEPARRAEMVERSGGRRSVPQIFIGDRHIGGSDDLHDLDRSGGLDPLLGTAAG